MRTTRTNLGLLLGLVALVLFGVVAGGLAGSESDLSLVENQRSLVGNGGFSAVFAALIGVMAMTSEFRHGTISARFRLRAGTHPGGLRQGGCKPPRRRGLRSAGAGLALVSTAVVLRARGFDLLIDAGDVSRLALGTIAMSALWAAFGVGLGALLRHQVLAIIGVFLWIFVVELLTYQYLPGVGRYAPVAAGTAITGDSLGNSPVHLLSAAAEGALLAGYAAAFVLVGALVTARRDVT